MRTYKPGKDSTLTAFSCGRLIGDYIQQIDEADALLRRDIEAQSVDCVDRLHELMSVVEINSFEDVAVGMIALIGFLRNIEAQEITPKAAAVVEDNLTRALRLSQHLAAYLISSTGTDAELFGSDYWGVFQPVA